ncbi:homoserine kinase [Alkalibaculum bacchi]|uniref:Homoserine kinase n=1 Tax=Alkalibaculum bacchi TaxID=645887 RepID=A0A366IDZ3_9FIRM|nr:homoserine kinase [Alkalibaculum bacchi]RBP68989.1 homoserine kinase [Alkalibaculum bacchi]
MYKISVPATSANIGPGFDSFGLALNVYNKFFIDYAEDLIFENCEVANNKNNLVYTSAMSLFNDYYKGEHVPRGLYIKFETQIPLSRGLGSSATCIVAGLIGANLLLGQPYSTEKLLEMAVRIEGHPDNVAPAFFGGLNISTKSRNRIFHKKVQVSDRYSFYVLIPDFTLSTSKSRVVLPEQVPFKDAANNIANASLMVLSLMDGDKETLRFVSRDQLHEPYRKELVPSFDFIKEKVLSNGGLSCFLSGAGPSLLCIVENTEQFERSIPAILGGLKSKWIIQQVDIDYNGAKWVKV